MITRTQYIASNEWSKEDIDELVAECREDMKREPFMGVADKRRQRLNRQVIKLYSRRRQ